MSATLQRDQAMELARTDPGRALAKARSVSEPWFRAQALAGVARFTPEDPGLIARMAAKAAAAGADDYQRSAVRAWEIAALAERDLREPARRALKEAVSLAETVLPIPSRSEALFCLLQAAMAIGRTEAEWVRARLEATCPAAEHWRCRRARRDAGEILAGRMPPRAFF